jgi:molybdopterin-containing oxidoreductase family iron-sulfur binding subunit
MTNRSGSKDIIQTQLAGKTGRRFWLALEELAETAEFRRFASDAFPALRNRGLRLDRRSLLKVMGASLALAGLSACKGEEDETALPYVQTPDGMTVGQARWYATAIGFAGYVQPVLGKTFAGRPVKLEGNPDHPVSKGATDAFTQAALLGLYDPGRSQAPVHLGKPADWNGSDAAMSASAQALDGVEGVGLRLLTGPCSSPTLLRQIATMMQRWPKARWHVCDPVSDGLRREATTKLFGKPLDVRPAFETAETIVSLDDDFLGPGPRQMLDARLFAARHRLRQGGLGQSRLFVAEPTPSVTGSVADARLVASVSSIDRLLRAIGLRIGIEGLGDVELSEQDRRWVDAASNALEASQCKGLVVVGMHRDRNVQALGLLLNERLGNFGTTLHFSDPVLAAPPDGSRSLDVLVGDMRAGKVSTLAIIGTDPAYFAPGTLDFRNALQQVKLRVHAGLHIDETAALCHWHVPLQHDLESWGDGRAVDGTASVVQPLVRPFYDVRATAVVLENLMGRPTSDRDLVQRTWQEAWGADFDARWRDTLNLGFVAGSASPLFAPAVVDRTLSPPGEDHDAGLTLVIRPDAGVWDGSLSENAWAQETPRPLTKVTWGNVILVSPQLATERRLKIGDEIRLVVGTASVLGPVWIMPGQEAHTLTVTLGYGQRTEDSIAAKLGYDAYALRRASDIWHEADVMIETTGKTLTIATTQLHQAIDGFDFVRTADVSQLDPLSQKGHKKEPPSFYPDRPVSDPSWGMSIDLDLCIGCNACVTAARRKTTFPSSARIS